MGGSYTRVTRDREPIQRKRAPTDLSSERLLRLLERPASKPLQVLLGAQVSLGGHADPPLLPGVGKFVPQVALVAEFARVDQGQCRLLFDCLPIVGDPE